MFNILKKGNLFTVCGQKALQKAKLHDRIYKKAVYREKQQSDVKI